MQNQGFLSLHLPQKYPEDFGPAMSAVRTELCLPLLASLSPKVIRVGEWTIFIDPIRRHIAKTHQT